MHDWQISAIEELKQRWYTIDEAIEELSENGKEISRTDFSRQMDTVDFDKEIGFLGKPQYKEEKSGGRGRPKKLYNHAAVEAIRSFALSDTFKKAEEEPIDFFVNNKWRDDISLFLSGFLKSYQNKNIDENDIDNIVDETLEIVGKVIVEKYYGLAGQNKFLVNRNKKLEDTKEYYIAVQQGVEERANELNRISRNITDDINSRSKQLVSKEVYHLKQTVQVNEKLDRILKLLEESHSENED
jgi:hypothetical protein